MSRRSAPDSPWQNGVPPFALCQPSFNPMMNCNPMWGQNNLNFMAGNMMTPNMMRYGDNTSSRSNFRRSFDQDRDRRFDQRRRPNQPHHSEGGYRGRGGGRYSRPTNRDGKRPAPPRSRSPPPKRAAYEGDKKDTTPKEEKKPAEKKEVKEDVEEQKEEEQTTKEGGENGDLYDPAEPTNDNAEMATKGDDIEAQLEAEAALDEVVGMEGDMKEASDVAREDSHSAEQEFQQAEPECSEEPAEAAEEAADGENMEEGSEAKQEKSGTSVEEQVKAPGKQQQAEKHAKQTQEEKGKDAKAGAKAASEEEPQQPTSRSPKKAEERKSDYRRDNQSTPYQKRQKNKGWCTVCEVNFEGSFLDHRRTDGHKEKRDQKYPKCHPCSMGFSNMQQYELHCAGNFHKKNVEIEDNEVDENAGPLGEEYLEEMTAYYCTLCHLLLKAESRDQHCRTRGHYKRHRDVKRREEASKPKAAPEEEDTKEKAEDEDAIFTITDEVGSDDEGKAEANDASRASGEGAPEKVQQPAAEEEQQPETPDAVVATGDEVSQQDVTESCDTTAAEDVGEDKPAENTPVEEAAVQHEVSGYKTAEEQTPVKTSPVAEKPSSVTTSTPKPHQTAVRGRGRGQIGRGRAVRGRRR